MSYIVENTTSGQFSIRESETAANKIYENWCDQIGEEYITIREI